MDSITAWFVEAILTNPIIVAAVIDFMLDRVPGPYRSIFRKILEGIAESMLDRDVETAVRAVEQINPSAPGQAKYLETAKNIRAKHPNLAGDELALRIEAKVQKVNETKTQSVEAFDKAVAAAKSYLQQYPEHTVDQVHAWLELNGYKLMKSEIVLLKRQLESNQ